MDTFADNIIQNPKTKNFPDGTMGNLRAELSLMAGFISAFIIAFVVWCVLFKYFSDKEDRERAELMARGVEMHSGVRHRKAIVEPTGMAEEEGKGSMLLGEQTGEGGGSGRKEN